MTRKKSNVKALALAVTCTILAGGGIGLEPVYAADVLYKETSGNVTTAAKNGETGNTIINELTGGGVKIGSDTDFTGISISGSSTSNHVTISDNDMVASGGVFANIIDSGLNARMSDGKVVAKNGLYIGYTSTSIDGATYDNSNFAVNGENGSFKAANGKFTVSDSGAITADSLTLADNYNVKNKIEANKKNTEDNKAALGTLETKTQGITRVEGNGTTVEGVNFKDGAVSGVKSINGRIKISDDGTVTINENATNNPVTINSKGIKVGNNSAVVSEDGFKTSGDLYVGTKTSPTEDAIDARFYVNGADGSIKAADGKFTVDDKGNVVSQGSVTAKGGLNVANGNFTVDGTTGNTIVGGTLGVTGNITGADITATGALKGQTLGIGGTGNDKFKVDADGAVKAAGGKVEIDNTGKATFGNIAGNITTIEGKQINTGSIVATDTTVESTISGVKMLNGKITASSMEITGAISLNDLKVNNKLTVGVFSVDNTGVVTGVKSINGANVTASGTGLTIGSAIVGAANPFSSNGFTVDATGNITAGTYNGNTIGADNKFNGVELKSGDVKAKKVTADTITDGTATMTGGTVTANAITANTSASLAGVTFDASGVDFNNKEIKNIAKVTATTADLGNLHIEGANITNRVAPTGGAIGLGTTVTVNNAGELGGIKKIDGVSVGAVTGNGLQFGGNAVIGATGKPFSSTGFEVDGAGNVTGKSFKVNGSNYLDSTGLTTEKAVIGGVNTLNDKGIDTSKNLNVGGQATFGDSTGTHTTINGGTITSTNGTDTTTIGPNKITTKTLDVEDIILRNEMKDGTGATINIKGSDGSMSVAKGKFQVDDKGQVTNHITATGAAAADTIFTTSEIGIDATFQKTGETASSGLKIDYNHAALNASGGAALDLKDKTATLGIGTDSLTTYTSDTIKSKVGSTTVTTKSGGTTFGDGTANNTLINGSSITSTKDGTFTTINGSSVRSYNSATGAGHLNGATLNLWKDSDNATYMTTGGATFTKDGKTTIISGDTITTGTLNVKDIVLGGTMYDATGHPLDGKLSIGNDGHLRAANGNFDVKDDGTFKNTVGNTTLQTDTTGASMKFDNTAADGGGGVTSEVAVEANKATVAAGDKASFVAAADNGGTATITGGTQTVTTTDKGTVFENSAHKTAFVDNGATNTIINGNEITTGKITTDQLVITGKGDADGNGGSIAFGGNGTIKSDINDGTANGKNTSFETTLDGVKTKVTDGKITTENNVSAAGNSNTVTKDNTHKSEFKQGFTSIGGVVTNGTVNIAQTLDGENGNITNEVTDKDGKSSKLVQNGTGLEYTDSAKPDNATRIDSSDVSIGSATDDSKRINLSDLGQIDELDKELTDRDEYKNNPTAVGGINAEAAIRREEVARLDGRINDVNDRVNKVGAMAAAIASLKSIGYDPQAPSEFSIGLGQYKGETGVAMGFFHYPNKNFMINVSLSTAGGETMGGIGATWRFGHKSPQKLLEEQREEQAKKELAAAEKYQAAAKLAKEAQERAEYAAKLARQAQVSADNAKAAADATQAKHFG